jgi:hypothetical protein
MTETMQPPMMPPAKGGGGQDASAALGAPASPPHRGLDPHDVAAVPQLSHAEAARQRQRVDAGQEGVVMLLGAQLADGAAAAGGGRRRWDRPRAARSAEQAGLKARMTSCSQPHSGVRSSSRCRRGWEGVRAAGSLSRLQTYPPGRGSRPQTGCLESSRAQG